MKQPVTLILLILCYLADAQNAADKSSKENVNVLSQAPAKTSKNKGVVEEDSKAKLKFVILCFNLSPPYSDEVSNLNKLAHEFESYVSSIVIKADDLTKYKELFTRGEFISLQDFISSKTQHQKQSTSFPVILILDKAGNIKNAWSGDKTDDGLKRDDFYIKIKAGLEAISQQPK